MRIFTQVILFLLWFLSVRKWLFKNEKLQKLISLDFSVFKLHLIWALKNKKSREILELK